MKRNQVEAGYPGAWGRVGAHTAISNTFEAEAAQTFTRKPNRANVSSIDFSYVPTPRKRRQGDADQIVFRPESGQTTVSGRYLLQYPAKRDHSAMFFKPENTGPRQRYFAQRDSSNVYSVFGLKGEAQ